MKAFDPNRYLTKSLSILTVGRRSKMILIALHPVLSAHTCVPHPITEDQTPKRQTYQITVWNLSVSFYCTPEVDVFFTIFFLQKLLITKENQNIP